MATETITLEVEAQLAAIYENASPQEKQKLQVLLELFLREIGSDSRARLIQLMGEMRREAAEKGLTEEILQGILDED